MSVYIAIQSASTRQDRANYPIKRAQAAVPRSPVYLSIRSIYASAPVYNVAADSSIRAASDVTVAFVVRLSRPGLHQHTGPHLSG